MKNFTLFIFFLIYNLPINATNIGTLNFEIIYSNINNYNIFLKEVNNFKINNSDKFKLTENDLLLKKNKIEDLRSIITEEELNLLSKEYNESLNILLGKVENINSIINKNVENAKNILRGNIVKIAQEIAVEKNIDIIFDENQYFISSKSIDISATIIEKINDLDIKLIFINE